MKVINKKTGKDMTKEVITNIEKKWLSEGIKLYKVSYTRDEDGKLVQHKTEINHE
tara:strand:- start:346 stop:510 length:165 start_codon:yes stop_codon:yes gene_type:complete